MDKCINAPGTIKKWLETIQHRMPRVCSIPSHLKQAAIMAASEKLEGFISTRARKIYMLNHPWLNLEWLNETGWVWMSNIERMIVAKSRPKNLGRAAFFGWECLLRQPVSQFDIFLTSCLMGLLLLCLPHFEWPWRWKLSFELELWMPA